VALRKNDCPSISTHEERAVGWRLVEQECHRKATLQSDPICGRRDIGQKVWPIRITAYATRDTLNVCTVEVPRMRIEPDPRGATRAEASQIILLVVRHDAPCRGID